jgi:mycothiol synthase
MDDLVVRPFHAPGDDAGVRSVRAAARALGSDPGPPAPNGLVALIGDRIVGYSRMDWWDEADGARLYLLSGCVDPQWRRRGIGRRLLARQEEQAAAHWAAQPGDRPALIGGNAHEALLRRAGYRPRFTLVDLARDPAGAADAELPAPLRLRPVEDDHHPLIFAALWTCFARSGLGQHRMSYEEYRTDVRDTDLWLIAWDGAEIAAVLINERRRDGSVDTQWLAVLPRWRRRGVAMALLRRSLRLLAGAGVRTATIRTVQENPDRTVALYERAGYRVTARHPRFAKPLGGSGGDGQTG